MKIFLLRHASPNLDRRDIPYDIHPGPELLPKGEKEAQALAEFLKNCRFDRTRVNERYLWALGLR